MSQTRSGKRYYPYSNEEDSQNNQYNQKSVKRVKQEREVENNSSRSESVEVEMNQQYGNDSTYSSKSSKSSNHPKMVRYLDKYENAIFIAGDREIHFNAQIDEETIARIKKLISIVVEDNKEKLVKFEKDGSVPSNRVNDPPVNITYLVNSGGGSVHAIFDFVDYVNLLRCTYFNIKFISIATGLIASAGTVMCAIADKKKMTRFAFAMIHELSTGLNRSNFTKICTYTDHAKDLHDVMITIYQESRGIDVNDNKERKKLERLLLDETWMSAEKYKSLGFVDEIIADLRNRATSVNL